MERSRISDGANDLFYNRSAFGKMANVFFAELADERAHSAQRDNDGYHD